MTVSGVCLSTKTTVPRSIRPTLISAMCVTVTHPAIYWYSAKLLISRLVANLEGAAQLLYSWRLLLKGSNPRMGRRLLWNGPILTLQALWRCIYLPWSTVNLYSISCCLFAGYETDTISGERHDRSSRPVSNTVALIWFCLLIFLCPSTGLLLNMCGISQIAKH